MSTISNDPPGSDGRRDASLSPGPAKPRINKSLERQLDSIWKQSRPIILDRLRRLDTFVLDVENGIFTQQQMEDATTIAHTFAGSLGMFGYPEGTELARSMEEWLDKTSMPNAATLRDYVAGLHTILSL